MTHCPECAGKMEWNSNLKKVVCLSCGLTLSRAELDQIWREIQQRSYEATDKYKRKKTRKKDWLNWYKSSNKDKINL